MDHPAAAGPGGRQAGGPRHGRLVCGCSQWGGRIRRVQVPSHRALPLLPLPHCGLHPGGLCTALIPFCHPSLVVALGTCFFRCGGPWAFFRMWGPDVAWVRMHGTCACCGPALPVCDTGCAHVIFFQNRKDREVVQEVYTLKATNCWTPSSPSYGRGGGGKGEGPVMSSRLFGSSLHVRTAFSAWGKPRCLLCPVVHCVTYP